VKALDAYREEVHATPPAPTRNVLGSSRPQDLILVYSICNKKSVQAIIRNNLKEPCGSGGGSVKFVQRLVCSALNGGSLLDEQSGAVEPSLYHLKSVLAETMGATPGA